MLHWRDLPLIKLSNSNFHQNFEDGYFLGFSWFDSSVASTVNTARSTAWHVPMYCRYMVLFQNALNECLEVTQCHQYAKQSHVWIWKGSLELKLEIIAQTERDTSGPQRTSEKYFPPLSARVTISHWVSDAQICNKSQRENTDGGRGEAGT